MTFLRSRYLRRRLEPVKIPARCPFPIDSKLIERQETARAELPDNSVKRLILENPDTFSAPVHLDEQPI